MNELKKYVRDIPGFPKQGIIFKDITTLLKSGKAFKKAVDAIVTKYKNKNIDVVLSIESRGFIFGAAVAYKLNAGVGLVRKKGKLPHKTYSASYDLEYGKDVLEIHQDTFPEGARVLIVDDLLATGGTTSAVVKLVNMMHGKVIGIAFLIELLPLKGREKLKGYPILSLIKDKYC